VLAVIDVPAFFFFLLIVSVAMDDLHSHGVRVMCIDKGGACVEHRLGITCYQGCERLIDALTSNREIECRVDYRLHTSSPNPLTSRLV
jgi:hypothetical protein